MGRGVGAGVGAGVGPGDGDGGRLTSGPGDASGDVHGNITLDTYSHVLPGLQEAAALALDSVLAEPVPCGAVSDV